MKSLKGKIFTEEGYISGEILIEGDIISDIKILPEDEQVECNERIRIIPGLVDIHSHGCMGMDTCETDADGIGKMADFEKSRGITSYCPTTMTYGKDKLISVIDNIVQANHANVKGIYLEGPFISYNKKGAQNGDYISKPDKDMLKELIDEAKGLAKVVAIAPETEGAIELISDFQGQIKFSMAHTEADYDTARAAIEAGASQITHLYNGMAAYNHRNPGLVGAAFDSDVWTELISDGIHIHDAVIRNTFKLAKDRVILISDSMEATGLGDGEYALGGQKVYVKGRLATLEDGTIAGSASTLMDCLKYAIGIGVDERGAINAATINPAKAIGIDTTVGSIVKGKKADILVMSEDFELIKVIQSEEDI